MAEIGTLHYLVVAAALFIIGTIGVLTRRNVMIILMSIELILNAVNLNLVAFSRLVRAARAGIFDFHDCRRSRRSGGWARNPDRVLPQQGNREYGRSGSAEVVEGFAGDNRHVVSPRCKSRACRVSVMGFSPGPVPCKLTMEPGMRTKQCSFWNTSGLFLCCRRSARQ